MLFLIALQTLFVYILLPILFGQTPTPVQPVTLTPIEQVVSSILPTTATPSLTIPPSPTASPSPKQPFTIVVLPDTQYYSEKYADIFNAQTQWIVNNKNELNTVFVSQLGDLVQHADEIDEWENATRSMSKLDNILPYGFAPGNHDFEDLNNGVADNFNQYFPTAKYQSFDWWGGNYLGNKNNYQFFSANDLDFINIHLEANAPDDVLDWAQRILNDNPNHQAIINTHIYLDLTGQRLSNKVYQENGNSGEEIWQKLIKKNCQIFLVLSAHVHDEALSQDNNDCQQPVYQILQDYQARDNGGDGWLRYLTFSPKNNKIYGYTYSPTLDQFEEDDNSQFSLDFNFSSTIREEI